MNIKKYINSKILYIVFIVWILNVVLLMSYHAMWRDEVRNFMIAIGRTSNIHLLGNPHPFLIYKIQQIGFLITNSFYVLPILSFIISLIAVFFVLFKSPFSYGLRCLIVFGYPTLYEYTVMSRNYGISVLLMVFFAISFSSYRYKYIFTGVILFFLANTNIHSAIIVLIFSILWPLNSWYRHDKTWSEDSKKILINSIFGVVGFLVCCLTIYPVRYDLAAAHPIGIAGKFKIRFLKHIAVYGDKELFLNYFHNKIIATIVYDIMKISNFLSIILSIFCLFGDAVLFSTATITLFSFSILFSVVYPGSYRHEALWVMLMVSLLWIKKKSNNKLKNNKINKIGYFSFYLLICSQFIFSIMFSYHEIILPNSRSKEFYKFLLSNESIKKSTVISSVDYILEPIPYYTGNKVFMLSLNDFDFVVPYRNIFNYNLDDLLHAAQKLAVCNESPPLILIVNDDMDSNGISNNIMDEKSEKSTRKYMYNYWTFTVTREQRKRFLENAHEIARYANGYLEEGFIVYQLNYNIIDSKKCNKIVL